MTIKRIVILLLTAAMLMFAACSTGGEPSAEQSVKQSSETPVEPQAEDTSADRPGNVSSTGPVGVNADNYPRVDGSTANIPLMASLYAKSCGVTIEEAETLIQSSGGTGAVWRNMMYDGADLLLVYEAPENIKSEMEQSGLLNTLEITPLGRDGLVFLVNAKNPVESLTREQLTGIYKGVITDWSEVGGDSGPIAAFQRNLESGSQTLFLALLMQGITPMEPPTELRPAGMGALIDAVATYDGSGGAIGFSVYYYANLMYESPNLKLLAVDGIKPTAESIGGNGYPLVNDFYVVIRKSEPENSPARILRDWLLTAEGIQLLLDANYIPVE